MMKKLVNSICTDQLHIWCRGRSLSILAKNWASSPLRTHPKKVAYWSEMARNVMESDFRSSKIAAGGHFVKKFSKKLKVAYWSEIARNAIERDFQSSKITAVGHFVGKKKVVYWSEKARNTIESDFRSFKMAGHFVKQILKKRLLIDLKWWESHTCK